ncbi:hypothetical protein ABMA32_01935 [Mesorhizobium sp. VNQ89]|uniref:hypothetical protein n=1 Tax=Mesorhizobium quangtriensis TaxID=3157709 RepID=UPI0032B81DAA
MNEPSITIAQQPLNPRLVLLLAILLPGAGHVAIGQVQRGLCFVLFAILLMVVTYTTTTPDQSFIGRHAGGLFVWALSITDAYRLARIRQEAFRRATVGAGASGA